VSEQLNFTHQLDFGSVIAPTHPWRRVRWRCQILADWQMHCTYVAPPCFCCMRDFVPHVGALLASAWSQYDVLTCKCVKFSYPRLTSDAPFTCSSNEWMGSI